MPVYEYACESCKERFEIKQKFTDEPLSICPRCSGVIHRVIQPTRVVFKGSGFYVTDHSKSNGQQNTKSDSKPATEKAEAKPANGEASSTTSAASTTETAKPEPSVSN